MSTGNGTTPTNGDAHYAFEDRIAQHIADRANQSPTPPVPPSPPVYFNGQVTPPVRARTPPLFGGRMPNTLVAVSTISFLLGGLCSLGGLTYIVGGFKGAWWATYQLGFFAVAWSVFHFAEFAVTAGWNTARVSVDSFLLDNGSMYHYAHAAALVEYLVVLYLKPELKAIPYVTRTGIILTVASQVLRSVAMIQAATNFSHSVQYRKQDGHILVTSGVYGWFRHPSYTGFYYWALGTQLVLQNPISFCLYFMLLLRFFSSRIKSEETALISFFGQDYLDYRKRVGTKLPFIR